MNTSVFSRWLGAVSLAFGAVASAISPEALQQQIEAGANVTFIDVRSASLFQQGHIPNAIHVPASLVPQKQLPPLGRVIVYDEGLGRETVGAAVTALNQKPGISAESLEGGLAGWEQAQSLSTRPRGLSPEELPMISYQQLKQVPAADLVLVDLRQGPAAQPAAKVAGSAVSAPLTDLAAEFPKARIVHSAFEVPRSPRVSAAAARTPPPLMVLIDNGDGTARETARLLKANGVKRFVILPGGEQSLARKGQSGLQRIGSSMTIHRSTSSSLTSTNK